MKKNFGVKIYRKYLIKSPLIFYGYLFLCLFLIFGVGSMIKLDIIETCNCSYANEQLIIPSFHKEIRSKAVFYVNRNEKIYPIEVKDYKVVQGDMYISCSDQELCEEDKKITGQIDVIIGKESLLERILD